MAKVYKRKDRDTWIADFRDHRGRRHRLSAQTRGEAEDLLAEMIKKAKNAGPAVDPSITLDAYAARWIDDVKAEMDSRTLECYQGNLTRHVLPELGRLPLGSITTGVVRNFLRSKRGAGYAQNTVRLMRAALSVVLSDAVLDEILTSNPAIFQGGRKRGAGKMTRSDREARMRPMDWDQRERFLAEGHNTAFGILFETLTKTGLRPSEAFALRLDDLDFRARTLRVERSIGVMSRQIKDTKTHETRDWTSRPILQNCSPSTWPCFGATPCVRAGASLSGSSPRR